MCLTPYVNSTSMSQEVLDLEEIVLAWASEFPLHTSQRRDAEDILPTDIDWRNFRVKHEATEYYDEIRQSAPRTHVIFTSHFTNNTNRPQVFKLRSERRTTSVCSILMDRTYTIGYSVDIKLGPPNPVVEANAGFKGEMSVKNSTEESFEEELVWSVDSQVRVPPKRRTTANMELTEQEYSSRFKCKTRFDGTIQIVWRSKRNNAPLKRMTVHVRDILTADKGFQTDASGIYYMSEGACKCRFGIEQHVTLSDVPIMDAEML